jgi:predicted ATPase/DNA-binding CsgD family transcriptional regulator
MEGQAHLDIASAAPAEMLAPAPALHTLRLQSPPTPFIGREHQVAQACSLLSRASIHLLTLTGPGGIGKTRLALAVAEAARTDFPAGVYSVSLAGLTDARLVMPAVAQALAVGHDEGTTGQSRLLQRLQDFIGKRRLLLVLDNFEQVIGAATDVGTLLTACPGLKVLVTSREVLRLSAEHCYDVPPLAVPDLKHLPPLEFLAQIEAVRLLVTRAQAARPNFALTAENAVAVATICHRLDGLPLAIELAAARIRLLPPAAMLARLEQRLPLLTDGTIDAPARHQTLRAAIAWSYDLLAPEEQQLFRRLAVFAGGFTVEAVLAVCGSPQDSEWSEELMLQTLASLLDKSLLSGYPPGGALAKDESRQEVAGGDHSRLHMLETIREFALERLAAGNEAEAMRRAHALYYVALAEEAEPGLIGHNQQAWLIRLEQEHDNVRAALGWAVDTGDLEIGARLASPLWRFWRTHGHMSEGRRWLQAVLAGSDSLPPALRARTLAAAGTLALRQGDYALAQDVLEQSLILWRALGDTQGEMHALNSLGLVAIFQNDFVRAQRHFEQSLAGRSALGDRQGMAQALCNLGLMLWYGQEFKRAEQVYQECLVLARDLPDKHPLAAVLRNQGQAAHHNGDTRGAHRLLSESFLLMREIDDRPRISICMGDLAGVWAALGQPERAARLFGAAEALRDKMGVIMYEAQRLAYERDVERGAAQLDAAAWEAAWIEGRTMPLDDAYTLALEELPPSDSDSATALQNAYDLTDREIEVLRLLVAGLTYAQIAEQLIVSFHTVHAHVRSVYGKLSVTSRSQATRLARDQGIV